MEQEIGAKKWNGIDCVPVERRGREYEFRRKLKSVRVWRVRTNSDDELRLLRRFGFVITVYPKSTAGPNAHEMGVFVVIFGI